MINSVKRFWKIKKYTNNISPLSNASVILSTKVINAKVINGWIFPSENQTDMQIKLYAERCNLLSDHTLIFP